MRLSPAAANQIAPVRRPRLWLAAVLGLSLVIALSAAPASGAEPSSDGALVEDQMKGLNTVELERLLAEIGRDASGYVPPMTLRSFIDLSTQDGGSVWNPMTWIGGFGRYLFREVTANSGLLGQLLVLAVIASVLQALAGSFERDAVTRLAQGVVYLVLASLTLGSFWLAVDVARAVIDRLRDFMLAFLPVLLTMLAGMGNVVLAGIFHPLMIGAVQIVSVYSTEVVFPLIFFAAVLDIASTFHDRYKLTGVASFIRQGALVLLGLLFTGFLGVMAVKGAAGAVADGVALRTGKFLASTFIPVVGKMFSDAAEAVIGSSMLLRNGLGIAGAAAILVAATFPILKIVGVIIVYRLAGALMQPIMSGPLPGALAGIANALTLVAVVAGVVSLMFFLGVTIVVGAGNLAMMVQ